MRAIKELVEFVSSLDGLVNKEVLKKKLVQEFLLVRDRSVYYNNDFAIRICHTSKKSFSNTVLSLSSLQKYDAIPVIICLVTPCENKLYLANTTFLSKISHSSQELRCNNIKGSFNGSDIIKIFDGIPNDREHILELFPYHRDITFEENLSRLVEATRNIEPIGDKFAITDVVRQRIYNSIDRAIYFCKSDEFKVLEKDLQERVKSIEKEIVIASHISNVNIRGRLIEILITEDDDSELKQELIKALKEEYLRLPKFTTKNDLGDYKRSFNQYSTATDIKTKIILLDSNPKAYNIDKFLEFLSEDDTVFLFFFVGIDDASVNKTRLVSVFQEDLLANTSCIKHWSGRNSRGVTQFRGKGIEELLSNSNNDINKDTATIFLDKLIEL